MPLIDGVQSAPAFYEIEFNVIRFVQAVTVIGNMFIFEEFKNWFVTVGNTSLKVNGNAYLSNTLVGQWVNKSPDTDCYGKEMVAKLSG